MTSPVGGTVGNIVYAYVDETGDRGTAARSSRFFAMAGVAVGSEHLHLMRDEMAAIKTALRVPPNKGLHWSEHAKSFARRQYVSERLGGLPMVVNYVVFEKAAIPTGSGIFGDHVLFYNYAAGLTMERLLLTARDWTGGPRPVKVQFAHVKGFDHTDTLAYFGIKRVKDVSWMPWHLLHGAVSFDGAGSFDGLQVADAYAGLLKAAIVADELGGYEEHHLLRVRQQIRRYRGTTWGGGFKVMALPNCMQSLPWWPPTGLD